MSNPLFSGYQQGENRVTASIMAVFERLNLSLVERILQLMVEGDELPLVRFENQTQRGTKSRPDARMHARFSFWFEVKTTQNSVRVKQLRNHLTHFDRSAFGNSERLYVLTPDLNEPKEISKVGGGRVTWVNFEALHDAIEEVKKTESPMPSEREMFLLTELRDMLIAEGLVGAAPDHVLIVPARDAYQTYLDYSVYICQRNRPFRKVERMGFYCRGEIKPPIPRVIGVVDSILIARDGVESLQEQVKPDIRKRLDTLIQQMIEDEWFDDYKDKQQKIFVLTDKDSEETETLSQSIENDLKTSGERITAWVQNRRYVTLESLKKSKLTSELETV